METPKTLMVCTDTACRVVAFEHGPNPDEVGIPYRDGSCPGCGGTGNIVKMETL